MIPIRVHVSESAVEAIQSQMKAISKGATNETQNATTLGEVGMVELIGAHCANNACKKVFSGPESDAEECLHHPGNAVFHEGMKFWSCCERKTTDFGTFLDQMGCARGKHNWKKKECVSNVREDWFQRGGQVHITIYCKGAIPEGTFALSDGLSLEVTIKHNFGNNQIVKRYELFGEIAPSESMVEIGECKVEIVLRQVAKGAWPKLLKQRTPKLEQHTDERQQQQQPIRPLQTEEEEVVIWNGLNQPSDRYATKRPMVPLQLQVSESAVEAIQSQLKAISKGATNETQNATTLGEVGMVELIGAHCANNACKKVFSGPESDAEECLHHPGNAVFHEGMKFWSCCERKTTDFGTFLDQVGCARGKHNWKKKECVSNVREDWFQRGGQVHITIYCKGALPEGTFALSDGLSLEVTIKHNFGNNQIMKRYDLFGEITPSESMLVISERKVEIVLKQVAKIGWPQLCYEAPNF